MARAGLDKNVADISFVLRTKTRQLVTVFFPNSRFPFSSRPIFPNSSNWPIIINAGIPGAIPSFPS